MFYSRASEALFLFIRLPLAGSVVFGTYPSKPAVGGIIKKCGIIKRFNQPKAIPSAFFHLNPSRGHYRSKMPRRQNQLQMTDLRIKRLI